MKNEKTAEQRKAEKEANIAKHSKTIEAIKVLSSSGKFTPAELYKFMDSLLGFRTWGETLDVQEYLQNEGVVFI